MTLENTLAKIAKEHCFVETLEAQGCDSLDFHDVSVWQLEKALKAAFKAGQMADGEKAQ